MITVVTPLKRGQLRGSLADKLEAVAGSRGGANDTPSTSTAPHETGEPRFDRQNYLDLPFDLPPLAWNVCSKAKFTSSSSFAWATAVPPRVKARGLADFLKDAPLRSTYRPPPSSIEEAWAADLVNASQYWVYPQAHFPLRHPTIQHVHLATPKAEVKPNHSPVDTLPAGPTHRGRQAVHQSDAGALG
jgi:hypothetical protein